MTVQVRSSAATESVGSEFRRGLLAMLPFWTGVVPFGATFAIVARGGGFSLLETQALSMLVFAGSAQIAIVTLAVAGAGAPAILLTTLILNLRHLLYAVSLNGFLGRSVRPPRWLLAAFLTDESYGVTVRDFLTRRGSAGFLFGASLSLYVSFTVATLVGARLGSLGPDPATIGLDFIFPLSFIALLLPLLRTRRQVWVAALAVALTLALRPFVRGGLTVLAVTIVAAALGASFERPRRAA